MPHNLWIALILSLNILPAFSPPAAAQTKPLTDLYGDPLPAGAIGRLGTTRLRHGTAIHEIAFLPDGKTLASVNCAVGGMVALWDLETGKERRYFHINGGHEVHAAFAPDCRSIAVADGENLRLYELATGKLRWQNSTPYERGGAGAPAPVCFTDDSRIVAGASGNRRHVHLWDAHTGKKLHSLDMNEQGGFRVLCSMVPSPKGTLLLTANAHNDDGGIIVAWDLSTGKRLYDFRGCSRGPTAVFTPDAKTIASVAEDSRTIELRDAATGKVLHMFEYAGGVAQLVFAPDGQTLAFGGNDGKVDLWDLAARKDVATLQIGAGWAARLNFSRDSRRLAVGLRTRDRAADVWQVWQVGAGKPSRLLTASGYVADSACALSDDSATFADTVGPVIRLWDVPSGKQRHTWPGAQNKITDLAIASDGSRVATTDIDSIVRVWDPVTQAQVAAWNGASRGHTRLAFTTDGKTLTTIGDHGEPTMLWDAKSGRGIQAKGLDFNNSSWALAPDGRTIVWTADNSAHVVDAITGARRANLMLPPILKRVPDALGFPQPSPWPLYRGVFAPDGRRLVAIHQFSEKKPMVQWDVTTGRTLPSLESLGQIVVAIGYSPDGRTVAGLTRREDERIGRWITGIHFWEAATGNVCLQIDNPAPFMTSLAFAPDGRQLAVGSVDGTIRLWNVATAERLRILDGHRGAISSLGFAPDGKTLFSASDDTTVLLWDASQPAAKEDRPALSAAALDTCWFDLCGEDAARAYRAVWALANAPGQAVPFLRSRLKVMAPPDSKQIRRWIADLDSDDYESRLAAHHRLAAMGQLMEPAAIEALKGNIPLELRRRLEQLTAAGFPVQREAIRAVQALELSGSADARILLQALSEGAAGGSPMREAQESLDRLAKRAATVS